MLPYKPIDPNSTQWTKCDGYICPHCGNEAFYGAYAHILEECTHRDEPGFPGYSIKQMTESFTKKLANIIKRQMIKEKLGIK